MKGFLYLAVCLLLVSCQSRPSERMTSEELKTHLKNWNEETQRSLRQLATDDPDVKAKAAFIDSVLFDTSFVDFLRRESFLEIIDSSFRIPEQHDGLLVIELRESGETVTDTKAIAYRDQKKVFVFSRKTINEWALLRSKELSRQQFDFLNSLKQGDKTDPYLRWGDGINDLLVITKVGKDSNIIVPILSLSNDQILSFDKIIYK